MKRDRKVAKAEALARCDYTERVNDWIGSKCLRRAEFEVVFRMSGTGAVSGTEHYCGQHYGLIASDIKSLLAHRTPAQ